jgi:hypothetical protein
MGTYLYVSAQRLQFVDVVGLFDTIDKNPKNSLGNVSTLLKSSSPGWSSPVVDRSTDYMATWKYTVGGGTFGIVRFVVQSVKETPLPKVVYECPYINSYENYVDDLEKSGAKLQDNTNQPDGSIKTVYASLTLI